MAFFAPSFDVVGQLPALRRYARALTRDEALAEDLVHDTLVRALEGRNSFRAEADLRSWLFSILHNVFVSGVKRTRASRAREDHAGELSDTVSEPEQEHAVRLAQLQVAFAALPAEQRAVLHLVAVEGLPYQDAAETLGIPIGTLMSRLGRARAALRSFEGAQRPGPAPATDHKLRIVGGTHEQPR
jgi:RNA polymerase sigma-70 factor, ECF subfamily